jgi:carbonic anhydrase
MKKIVLQISIAIFVILTFCSLIFVPSTEGKTMNTKAKEALNILMEGNKRYAEGKLLHPHQGIDRRKDVAEGQHPIAIIVACSDSRVPPEIVFDQGLGDIFVVRVAGNVLSEVNIGSIDYAAEHFGIPLVIVLGHTRCGAVTVAVKGGEVTGHVRSILEAIEPAVNEARKQCRECDLVDAAARINVDRVVKNLQDSGPILSHLIKEGKLTIVGAYYDLDTGKVELLSK